MLLMQTINKRPLTVSGYPLWLFISLPAISTLLGWGLRGFIGGGPFGAMIPGAMLMLTIVLLLEIPSTIAAIIVLFATVGIAIGGEMTYGQTLGFLRHPESVWWGTCGTTVKGGVWGLVGGTFIGLGLIHQKIKTDIIIKGLLIFLMAFVAGLKLINDPKLIYFSDPVNKPRQESWAGLLFAATALLVWLRIVVSSLQFRLVLRFAIYGLIGGALGFGLGGGWLVLGASLGKGTWITEWWKLMEFSFGLIMGGFLGYAAWRSRNEIAAMVETVATQSFNASFIKQFLALVIAGVLIYLMLPLLDPFVEAHGDADGFLVVVYRTIARVIVNYSFIAFLLIVIAMRWPFAGFQLAVTITFSHTVIDLVDDWDKKNLLVFAPFIRIVIVVLSSAVVSCVVYWYQRKKGVLKSMFLILVWSTVAVAFTRMLMYSQFKRVPGEPLLKFIVGDMLVFNFFLIAAIIVSYLVQQRIFKAVNP